MPLKRVDRLLGHIQAWHRTEHRQPEAGYVLDPSALLDSSSGVTVSALHEDLDAAAQQGLISATDDPAGTIWRLTAKGVARLRQLRPEKHFWRGGIATWISQSRKSDRTGGQGAIWKVRRVADDAPIGKMYALKEMRWQKTSGSTLYRRFLAEIEETSRLSQNSASIVEVVDQGQPESSKAWKPFYVMPWADSTLARATDLAGNLEAALQKLLPIAKALVTAHAHNVVHRDIKPANVLLFGYERRPVLADFGICFTEQFESRITKADAKTIGTHHFAAPELMGGGRLDEVGPAADVYSLGKTLYAVVAGGEVFPREDHQTKRWNLAERFADDRLKHLHGLLDVMVTATPASRVGEMQACVALFERALDHLRNGMPYRPGLYAGRVSGVELARSAREVIGAAPSASRSNKLQDLLQVMCDAVDRVADTEVTVSNAGHSELGVEQLQIEAADILLAVALPAVESDDEDYFSQWLVPIRRALNDTGGHYALKKRVWRGSAVAACYGVGMLAWHRQRLRILRKVLQLYQELSTTFLFSSPAPNSAQGFEWTVEFLTRSPVRLHMAPQLDNHVTPLLSAFFGVALLFWLRSYHKNAWTDSVVSNTDIQGLEPHPALSYEAREWPELLAGALRHDARRAASVSQELFGLAPDDFRAFAGAVLPAIRRYAAIASSWQRRPRVWTNALGTGNEWTAWVRGDS